MNIPFSPPDISESEINEVIDALRSGWITTGPKTKELEREVAEFCGTEKAVCLNSATACLELALRLLDVGPGDEVIVPAYTYTATASVVCHVGAKVVMCDSVGEGSSPFEMDYKKMASLITERTKVIIPVDLGGRPCDYQAIYDAIEEKASLFSPRGDMQKLIGRIVVLADAAHSFGASYSGIPAGKLADFTSFSFHAVKNFTTAEGGALTWRNDLGLDNEDVYKKLMLASLHGQNKDALAKSKAGAWEYDILYPAYKCNMTDIHAAIGLAQMKRYPGMLKRRKEIIEKYDQAFNQEGIESLLHYDENSISSGHLYLVRVPGISWEERNRIIEMMGERGVSLNVHYKPLPMLTAYKELGFKIEDYPKAGALFENLISIPLYSILSDQEVGYIIDNFIQCCREVKKC